MNRRPSGFYLYKAIEGFEQYKAAEGLSPKSLVNYSYHLKVFKGYMGEVAIESITSQDISGFLAWLRTDYEPRRLSRKKGSLSPKTIRNIWVTLSSLFSWAADEFEIPSPMKRVPAPRFKRAPVHLGPR